MKDKQRNHLLDLFKLIAAFLVMHLHTRLGIDYDWNSIIRYYCRWAVPFFFITAGYYLAKKNGKKSLNILNIKNNLLNLIAIFTVANLIYFAITVLYGNIWVQNDIKYILIGSFWHLWFLGAMIFSYLAIWFIDEVFNRTVLYICGTVTVVFCIFFAQFSTISSTNVNYSEIPRFVSGFGCMVSGMLFSQINFLRVKKLIMIAIIITTISISYLELTQLFLINLYDIEFSTGIYLLAATIFICYQTFSIKTNNLSKLGNNHSLFIYLYHVLIYKILEKLTSIFHINRNEVYIIFPITALVICIMIAIFLSTKFDRFYKLLNGRLT